MRTIILFLTFPLLGTPSGQDVRKSEITEHEVTVLDGQFLDLDTATALSRKAVKDLKADVQFLLINQKTFQFLPVNGARLAPLKPLPLRELPNDLSKVEFGNKALEVDATNSSLAFSFAILTDRGNYAKARAAFPNVYQVPSLSAVKYYLRHDARPVFPAAVSRLRATFAEEKVAVSWIHEGPARYEVRWTDRRSSTGTRTVNTNTVDLEGLAKERVYSVTVRPLADGALGIPSRVSVLTAHKRIITGRIEGRNPNRGYAVNFRTDRLDEKDPDWIPLFWGMRVPPGGGLQKIGEGQGTFDRLLEIPTDGYTPFHSRFDEGDVFAVRLRDGRYAKVFIRPETSDVRAWAVFDYAFLAGEGTSIPEGPSGLKGRFDGASIVLTWEAYPGAASYDIYRIQGMERRKIDSVKQPVATIAGPTTNVYYDLSVVPKDKHGAEFGTRSTTVSTYPSWWQTGEVAIDWSSRNGFDFERETVTNDTGDFFITNSAGGMSSLTITAPRGISNSGIPTIEGCSPEKVTTAFKEIPLRKTIQTDTDRPKTLRFIVKTSSDRYALVSITRKVREPTYGRIFEYVCITPLRDASRIVERVSLEGLKVPDGLEARIRALLPDLDDPAVEVRERAQERMRTLPRAGILVIGEILKKDSLPVETKVRLRQIVVDLYHRPKRK